MAYEIVLVSGSPSRSSRSRALFVPIISAAEKAGMTTTTIEVRELPAGDLLAAARDSAAIASALATVASANGIVVSTPTYKAAYTGLLKSFLDLFPDGALRGKVAFPIVTAAAPAHALALDFALKPVLASMYPSLTVAGFFAVDSEFESAADGTMALKPDAAARLDAATRDFLAALR